MINKKIIIGTRGSRLALVQANAVAKSIAKHFPNIEIGINVIKTKGDKIKTASLSKSSYTGLFVKEIEDALLTRKIDIAVHSLKDLPTKSPKGLLVAAYTKRESANDVLLTRPGLKGVNDLMKLPPNARIGTSSVRRTAQLKYLRPDIITLDMRGNLDTRLKKLSSQGFDGIIVANAGLNRIKAVVKNKFVIPIDRMLPCPGQGMLAIQTRKNDSFSKRFIKHLNDKASQYMAKAELTALKTLDGGCSAPIGIIAEISGKNISVSGCVLSPNGDPFIKASKKGPVSKAKELGRILGKSLINMGARKILREARNKYE